MSALDLWRGPLNLMMDGRQREESTKIERLISRLTLAPPKETSAQRYGAQRQSGLPFLGSGEACFRRGMVTNCLCSRKKKTSFVSRVGGKGGGVMFKLANNWGKVAWGGKRVDGLGGSGLGGFSGARGGMVFGGRGNSPGPGEVL